MFELEGSNTFYANYLSWFPVPLTNLKLNSFSYIYCAKTKVYRRINSDEISNCNIVVGLFAILSEETKDFPIEVLKYLRPFCFLIIKNWYLWLTLWKVGILNQMQRQQLFLKIYLKFKKLVSFLPMNNILTMTFKKNCNFLILYFISVTS